MQNRKYIFAKEEGIIKAWEGESRKDTLVPDVIIAIDLDDEEVQAEFFKRFMRERLMKSGSEEGLDVMRCDKAEAFGIMEGIELNGKKIAKNDTEAEAIFEYLIANQICEYTSGKVILLDDIGAHTKEKDIKPQKISRWLMFLDTTIDILSKGKEKTEAIKAKYVKILESEKLGLLYSSKIKSYLEAISRVESKYREGEIAREEYEAFKQAEEKIKTTEQRERNLRELIKEIAEGFRSFEDYLEDADYVISVLSHAKNNLNAYLRMRSTEEIEAFQKVILGVSNAVRIPITPTEITPEIIEKGMEEHNRELDTIEKELKILQIKSEKIEYYPKIMLNVAKAVKIPVAPVEEISQEEIEKFAEKYVLDIGTVKRGLEIAKEGLKELTIDKKEE